jgi:hypothetical protein
MATHKLSKSRTMLSTAGFCAQPTENLTTMLPNDGPCDVYVSSPACCSLAMSIFFICNGACITRSAFFGSCC